MKILIIEDQAMVRDMLAQACRKTLPEAELFAAGTGELAYQICSHEQPELVLLDLGLPDVDGLELVGELFKISRRTKVIVLSGFTDEFTVHRALGSSVHAFLDKNEQPLDVLDQAIGEVLAGRQYLSPSTRRIQAALRADPTAFSKVLSEREQELLGLFGRGLSNEEVATLRELSVHTVKIHRRNIMGKLGLHSTPHLIRYAIEKGFTRFGRVAEPVAWNTRGQRGAGLSPVVAPSLRFIS